MPIEQITTNLLTPTQEIAKRTGEAGAGLAAAASAVGLADHREMLRDHAARIRDGHRLQMELLGIKAEEPKPEEDDMGIMVTGDINVYGGDSKGIVEAIKGAANQKPAATPTPAPQPTPIAAPQVTTPTNTPTATSPSDPQTSVLATIGKALAVAALGMSGAGGAAYLLPAADKAGELILETLPEVKEAIQK